MNGSTVRVLRYSALPLLLAAPLAAQQFNATQSAQRIEALQRQQCVVQEDVRDLRSAGADRDQAITQLREIKNGMHSEVLTLEAEFSATPALQGASEVLRTTRLAEKIRYSLGTIQEWRDGSERTLEFEIQRDLAAVRAALLPNATPITCGAVPA